MKFGEKSVAKSGDNGNSIVGNDNNITTVNFDMNTPKVLSKSLIAGVCKTIAEMNIEFEDDYSIQQNSDWMQKFDYNSVKLYIDVFDNYSDGYDEVSKVLQGHLK